MLSELNSLVRDLKCFPALLSSVVFPLPFANGRSGLLLMFADNIMTITARYTMVPPDLLVSYELLCLDLAELWQLSLPSPSLAHLGLPYWARYRGEIVSGADLRSAIPLYDPRVRLVALQLDLLDGIRERLILRPLVDSQYGAVLRNLTYHRRLLMYGALLEGQTWEIDPGNLELSFCVRFPECTSLVEEFKALPQLGSTASIERWRDKTHEAIHLFDEFTVIMRRCFR